MRLLEPSNETLRNELNTALEVRRQAWFTLQDAEERLCTHCSEHALAAFQKAERAYIDVHRVYKNTELLLDPLSVDQQ